MKIEKFYKKEEKKIETQTPYIVINNPNTFNKLISLIRSKDVEIMLLGVVNKKENIYIIEDFLIPPMDNNSTAFVTSDDEKFGEWLYAIPRDKRQKLRLHLHTHPKMGITPSSTDEEMIRDKVENISDYYIRIIANHDLKFRVDFFDLTNNLLFKEMKLYYIIPTKYGTTVFTFEDSYNGHIKIELNNQKENKEYEALITTLNNNIKNVEKHEIIKKEELLKDKPKEENNKIIKAMENLYINFRISSKKFQIKHNAFKSYYSIAESPSELLEKAEAYEQDLLNWKYYENNNIKYETFISAYYDIAYNEKNKRETFIQAFRYELLNILVEVPQLRKANVESFVSRFYPGLDETLQWYKNSKTGILLKEEKMTVEEWFDYAKYLKAPKLLQSDKS